MFCFSLLATNLNSTEIFCEPTKCQALGEALGIYNLSEASQTLLGE